MVGRTMMRPPSSRLGPILPEERRALIANSPVAGVYDTVVDRDSAFEVLTRKAREKAEAEAAQKAREQAAKAAPPLHLTRRPTSPPLQPRDRRRSRDEIAGPQCRRLAWPGAGARHPRRPEPRPLMLAPATLTLAVFASDKGPGDAERANIMSQVGSFFARNGARIVCLAEDRATAVPLVTSARTSGGEVIIVADSDFKAPAAMTGVPIERLADREARLQRMAELATVFVGLPGSLTSASSLYMSWVRAGGGPGGKPVVLYNRNGAFEVMRGYAADVLSHGIRHHDRYVQFADSVEDMWNKINWLIAQPKSG